MIYLGLVDGQIIPDNYDEYIWASERCLEGIKWCNNKKKKYTVLKNNFTNDKEIMECRQYLDKNKSKLMEYCVVLLNEYNGTSYNTKSWNYLLSQWMNVYLFSLYDKYLKLKMVIKMSEERDEEIVCHILDNDELAPPLDFLDFTSLLFYTDDYHLFQYSMLAKELKLDNYLKVFKEKKYSKPDIIFPKKTKGYYKVIIYRGVIALFKFFVQKRDFVVLQNSYLPYEFILEASKKNPARITNYITDYARFERKRLNYNLDYKLRKSIISQEENESGFLKIAKNLLAQSIPVAYLEGFGRLVKLTRRIYKYAMKPRAVIFANGATHNDECFKAYLMEIENTSATLCGVQHGGDYGITRQWCFDSEYEMCDIFYTWGWSQLSRIGCYFHRMPLAKMVGKVFDDNDSDDILYINYIHTKNIFREDKKELFFSEQLIQDEMDFMNSLTPEIKLRLRVRMYMDDYGWNIKKRWENMDGIQYDTIKDYYTSLKSARLVIASDWSTTVVESLCAGKPTLVRRDRFCIENEAKMDLEELHRVGVLSYTYKELGERLNDIIEDIDSWWNEPHRQSVVRRICDKYAFMPRDAKQIWVDEINSYCEE